MNSYYYQDTPAQRRHSAWDVSLAPKWRNRSHSAGLINLAGFSPGLSQMNTNTNAQRAPATPCFVSPRMAFSTQFSYDSPIQILTSGKGASTMLDPRSVSKLRGRCSFRRLSRRCKIVLILLFAALGTGLFINRKMHEISDTASETKNCNDEDECEEPHVHPGLAERFLEIVSLDKIQHHFHAITKDLRVGSTEEEAEQPEAVRKPEEPNKEVLEELNEAEDEESEGLRIIEESVDRNPRSADDMSDYEEELEDEDEEEQEGLSDPQTNSAPSRERRGQTSPGTRRTVVVARNTLQEKESARSQKRSQTSGHQQRRGNSRSINGRPQDGRRYGQKGRSVKVPPGVNPRRYGL